MVVAVVAAMVAGCGSEPSSTTPPDGGADTPVAAFGSANATPSPAGSPTPPPTEAPAFRAGNPKGTAAVPAEARPVDTSRPDRVVGTGTPASCTSTAVVSAVAAGGIITFDCGPAPVTIAMKATAKVVNARSRVVLDGGGTVTLSGGGARRILYLNTCDKAQGWTTSHCDDQSSPRLTVQNITLANGNATGQTVDGGGGGAIFARGGRLKVSNVRFTGNRCDRTGPDLGGAAIRALDQYHRLPVYVVSSTFTGGVCSNGAGFSSIGVSWVVLNSLFTGNAAVGSGANPARGGTAGGGSGGAIYLDGNLITLRLAGTVIERNTANEGGGAVFFVSNDRTGTMRIEKSTLRGNPSRGFETAGFPGIFFLGAANPTVTGSTLTK